MIVIPPEIQTAIGQAVGWLWAGYGQKVIEQGTTFAKNQAQWRLGIEKYYTSLYGKVGFVLILGRREAEPLENVFTHVNVLDRLSAERRYTIERLTEEAAPRDFAWHERVKRLSGNAAVAEYPKLFVLGKPGAGKTTFLKYTALRAIRHEIKKVPIFVSLKELSDSGKGLLEFIVHQFDVHRFPNPAPFVADLLKDGEGLLLFDGLDEVNLEGERRATLIAQLNDFVYQYSDCPMLLTCRVAATDYSFTQFEYVEMADFDTEQMGRYVDHWFVGNETKRKSCRRALLEEEGSKGVRELA
ncbi:MAG: NACHT domain-containing protein, partial [Anaerolineales bacterium]|nr:NACHT domain-containing protein [Anaerolineales bacterium]